MTKKSIKAVLLTVLAVSLLLLAACAKIDNTSGTPQIAPDTDAVTIKIGYLPITHALPLYVENELAAENLKKVKLELVKFGSWPELVDALNAGKIDGASMLIELAMKAKEQGIDLKAVALGHRDGNAVIVANDINTVVDLKGETFAIPSKLSSHNILLYLMLKNSGLEYGDINVIELPPPEMPAALSEGRISGYIVAEPFGAVSVAGGNGKMLFESQDLWADSICCGLVLRNDYIQNNSAASKEFIEAYIKAGQQAELKDQEIKDMALKYLKVEPQVLDLSLQWISYQNLKLEEKDYNQLSAYLVEMGLSKNPPAYDAFVNNSFFDKET